MTTDRTIANQINDHMNPGATEVPEDSFHRSLDRALDPHNDWGVEGDALTDILNAREEMSAAPIAALGWEDAGFTILDGGKEMSAAPIADLGWRDFVFPASGARFIAGIDQTEDDFDPEFVSVKWGEPVTLSIDLTHIATETIDLLFGLDLRPLYAQELPAKGQE